MGVDIAKLTPVFLFWGMEVERCKDELFFTFFGMGVVGAKLTSVILFWKMEVEGSKDELFFYFFWHGGWGCKDELWFWHWGVGSSAEQVLLYYKLWNCQTKATFFVAVSTLHLSFNQRLWQLCAENGLLLVKIILGTTEQNKGGLSTPHKFEIILFLKRAGFGNTVICLGNFYISSIHCKIQTLK